jgi:hypothetical protein
MIALVYHSREQVPRVEIFQNVRVAFGEDRIRTMLIQWPEPTEKLVVTHRTISYIGTTARIELFDDGLEGEANARAFELQRAEA